MPTVPDIHRRGLRADQPAATAVTVGTLYCVTDEGEILERSTGAAWESYGAGTGSPRPIHATTHQTGGVDPIALDTLAAPTDVTTLNATTSAHGLLPKLSGAGAQFLDGTGAWTTPATGGGTPGAHATTHQNGGADEISVVGLSGLLADGQTPLAHATTHNTAGSDAITALAASVITTGTIAAARLPARIGAVGIIIDGGGSVITTGVKGFVEVPFACIITAVTLLSTDAAVTSGSIVIDIWKDTYAAYPPVVGDTITASAKPTISGATKSKDATLTGWTTTITAGDILGFKVDSVSTVVKVLVSLTVQAT